MGEWVGDPDNPSIEDLADLEIIAIVNRDEIWPTSPVSADPAPEQLALLTSMAGMLSELPLDPDPMAQARSRAAFLAEAARMAPEGRRGQRADGRGRRLSRRAGGMAALVLALLGCGLVVRTAWRGEGEAAIGGTRAVDSGGPAAREPGGSGGMAGPVDTASARSDRPRGVLVEASVEPETPIRREGTAGSASRTVLITAASGVDEGRRGTGVAPAVLRPSRQAAGLATVVGRAAPDADPPRPAPVHPSDPTAASGRPASTPGLPRRGTSEPQPSPTPPSASTQGPRVQTATQPPTGRPTASATEAPSPAATATGIRTVAATASRTPTPLRPIPARDTPTMTPQRSPTAAPDPTETDEPSETPEPSQTREPTETDEPTRTPRSSETPRPTETRAPTRTPRPSDTREPTRTARPTRTPRPTETDDAPAGR